MPTRAVVETGLRVGTELTRPVARDLRRALRRSEAIGYAERLLTTSERSTAQLRAGLERRGVAPAMSESLLAELERAGLVSDARAAVRRAQTLADRSWGDAAIASRLAEEGYDDGTCADAIATLDGETERARAALARKERKPAQAARFLMQRGFDPDLVQELRDTDAFTEG